MAQPKPAILLLGSQMAVAGAQRVLLDQADWFSSQGYPVVVAFLYDRDGLGETWQTGRSYPIIDLKARQTGAGKLWNLIHLLAGMARLWKLLRQKKFQAIETFTHHSNLIGCPLAWLSGVPVRIASHHGSIERMAAVMERIHAWMINLGLANRLVVVSTDIYQRAIREGVRADHLVIIPNGITAPQIDPDRVVEYRQKLVGPSEGPAILSVGRLTYQKAHTFLLQALPEVLKCFPQVRLTILGDGPLMKDLTSEANRLGIADRVSFLGFQPDVRNWMVASDLFVLPSRWEGLPLVVLEAMSIGCGIAATRVQGISEALADDTCGLTVRPEDPGDLAAVMIRLLSDADLRSRLGQAAQQRFRQSYTLDIMAQRYLEVLIPNALAQKD